MTDTFVELTYSDGATVRLEGTQPPTGDAADSYLMVKSGGIAGWWSTPTPKVSRTELGQGDGASNVQTTDIRYSARTVTIEGAAVGRDHAHVMAALDRLLASAHQLVTVRVHDTDDTTCTGNATVTSSHSWSDRLTEFTLTVECSQPERLAATPQTVQLICKSADQGGGLSYGPGMYTYWEGAANDSVSVLVTDTLYGTSGLHYPLTYRIDDGLANRNTGLLANHGTSRAYPRFEVTGPLPEGVELRFPGTGLTLACACPLNQLETLVLDSRTRTASINGRDITETVTSRGFPTIPAGGSLNMVLVTTGQGWVQATVHDTYI